MPRPRTPLLPKATKDEIVKLIICKLDAAPSVTATCSVSGKHYNSVHTWVNGKRAFNLFQTWARIRTGGVLKASGVDADLTRAVASGGLAWHAAFAACVNKNKKNCKHWALDAAKQFATKPATADEKSAAILKLCPQAPPSKGSEFDKAGKWVPGRQPFNLCEHYRRAVVGAHDAARVGVFKSFIATVKETKKKVPWAIAKAKQLESRTSSAMESEDRNVKKKMGAWSAASKQNATQQVNKAVSLTNRKENKAEQDASKKSSGFALFHATTIDISKEPKPDYLLPKKAEGMMTGAGVWAVAPASIEVMQTKRATSRKSKKQARWASKAARSHALKKSKGLKGRVFLYKINFGHSSVKKWNRTGGMVGSGDQKRPMMFCRTKISIKRDIVKETWRFTRPKLSSTFDNTHWKLI